MDVPNNLSQVRIEGGERNVLSPDTASKSQRNMFQVKMTNTAGKGTEKGSERSSPDLLYRAGKNHLKFNESNQMDEQCRQDLPDKVGGSASPSKRSVRFGEHQLNADGHNYIEPYNQMEDSEMPSVHSESQVVSPSYHESSPGDKGEDYSEEEDDVQFDPRLERKIQAIK